MLIAKTIFSIVLLVAAAEAQQGLPWPKPREVANSDDIYSLDPKTFQITITGSDCDLVKKAVDRYMKTRLFPPLCKGETPKGRRRRSEPLPISNLTINIAGPCENTPKPDMDESYVLQIGTNNFEEQTASIVSVSEWGALHALETFSQLIYRDENLQWSIRGTLIRDYPRFSFRGFMIDTSRHYLAMEHIYEMLDLMEMNKFNVLHWHIVDDQSFPYESKLFPEMHAKGAFNPISHIYSVENIGSVIEYARQRGIRVLPEFDTPGHSLSWGKGVSGLLTSCYKNGKPDGTYGPIDPSQNDTYNFLTQFFQEVTERFPDTYVHLGGDEVDFSCWKSNPNIQAFMKKMNINDYAQLESFYINTLLAIMKQLDRNYIVWQEVFDNKCKIAKDTIVDVWKSGYQKELGAVTQQGYKAILSACWYLNYIGYGEDWEPFYQCEPYNFDGTDAQKKLIIGGEACMWGEYVDGTNVITRTWPRASTVAERLWSDQSVTNINDARTRLNIFRCLMMRRGYGVEPFSGPGYCPCDANF